MTPVQLLLFLGVCLAWAFHMIVIKTTVELVEPLTYVAFRMPFLALILAPLLRWHQGQMLRILIGGACFGGLNYAFMFTGFSLTTASIGAVVIESYVVIATLLSVVFLREHVGWRRSLGIVAALIGVVTIATADSEATGSRNLPLGALLLVLAATSEATGALFVKKIEGVKPLALLAWFAVVGTVLTGLFAAVFERDHFAWISGENRTQIIGALAYSVLVASLFGHAAYYYLLQRVPLSVVAPSGLLITFFAMLMGVTLLAEPLTPKVGLGAGMVVAGVAIILVRSQRPDRKQVVAATAAAPEDDGAVI